MPPLACEPHPASIESSRLHQQFIDKLRLLGLITSETVESAFRAVRRDIFLPHVPIELVYSDRSIVTKTGSNGVDLSSASQPALVAGVLEQLDLQPGHNVLEIGAGTGYNAALLGQIVGTTGKVWSIDIDEDIVARARTNLAAVNARNVTILLSDGAYGNPGNAPFDRIVLTVACSDVPPDLCSQLKEGGRIVVPLSIRGPQRSIAFLKRREFLESVNIRHCHYVYLRGSLESNLGPDAAGPVDLRCELPDSRNIDCRALLSRPQGELSTSIQVTMGEIASSLSLWLALSFDGFCIVTAKSDEAQRWLFGSRRSAPWFTAAVYRDGALCALSAASGHRGPLEYSCFELSLRSFGVNNGLASEVLKTVRAWLSAGRPGDPLLSVRAFPRAACSPCSFRFRLERPSHTYFFDWSRCGKS
jgi:protein-L-isoaspartate(D-aspartate) O-methyltransferase